MKPLVAVLAYLPGWTRAVCLWAEVTVVRTRRDIAVVVDNFKDASTVAVWALVLGGCVSRGSAGIAATGFVTPMVAAAYLPLSGPPGAFFQGHGAGVVVAPGIAATNAHNVDFVEPSSVIGVSAHYDLMYFTTPRQDVLPVAVPRIGDPVIAYGQGRDGTLRVASGLVRRLEVPVTARCPGCPLQQAFAFDAPAGEGFSGGPVVDQKSGRLVGIVFGYLGDSPADGRRMMYAYTMDRILAEMPGAARAGGPRQTAPRPTNGTPAD